MYHGTSLALVALTQPHTTTTTSLLPLLALFHRTTPTPSSSHHLLLSPFRFFISISRRAALHLTRVRSRSQTRVPTSFPLLRRPSEESACLLRKRRGEQSSTTVTTHHLNHCDSNIATSRQYKRQVLESHQNRSRKSLLVGTKYKSASATSLHAPIAAVAPVRVSHRCPCAQRYSESLHHTNITR